MRVDLQVFRALVFASEIVNMVEAGKYLPAVDRARIEIDLKHFDKHDSDM